MPLFPDTKPEAEAVLVDLMRKTPGWRKLRMVGQLNRMVRVNLSSGLRQRFPDASEAELRRRLADILLGPELALKAYGPEMTSAMNEEPLAVMMQVIKALKQLQIPYFIGGSIASNFYGVARSTLDADIVAAIRPDQVDVLVELLQPVFYIDAGAIRDAVQRKRCFNAIHLATMFKVDIFVAGEDAFTREQFHRRQSQVVMQEPEQTAFIATVEDMILTKLQWYKAGGGVSDRQWRDVLEMLKACREQLDSEYLERWATELGVDELLEKARKEW